VYDNPAALQKTIINVRGCTFSLVAGYSSGKFDSSWVTVVSLATSLAQAEGSGVHVCIGVLLIGHKHCSSRFLGKWTDLCTWAPDPSA
jgi:hypothetical protein